MMLVVIANVERKEVERAIVTVSLLLWVQRVMFLDPAGPQRMAANREKERGQQVEQPIGAAEEENGCIE